MLDRQGKSQAANNETDDTKSVLVGEDYLLFLHDAFSENQARLREIFGESQARAVFSWCADRLVRTVKVGKYTSNPIEGVVRRLSSWGLAVTWKEGGNLTELKVKCPYAKLVHPRMPSRERSCPVGEYILGAVRLEDSRSQLIHNGLTEDGVRFTLKGSRQGD